MRKLSVCLLASCALIVSTASSFAFEAMLAHNFTLYPHPYSHERLMTLGAGDYVDIDRCDHGWCAVTHGPHSGYIRSNHMIDGEEYAAAHGGGYDDDNPVGAAAGLVAAPVEAGVSLLR
ncbi:hypothetical protein AMST5_04213 [freshwater sediment metagenome]|jgi:hypothetical protein|uniref:SH3b domain-containing protein n=1 Tax=freshwater sediment metagenome TaxID=556182 RepID=A0AA48M4I6_9ZZZZ